jgi:hypothetical protein
MNLLKLITDNYERKARLYPALVLLLPIIVTTTAILSSKISVLQSLIAPVIGCGGAFLLAQLARDAGKKIESSLFAEWGGMPSVSIFRHRDTRIDSITKARYHKRLAALVKEKKAPKIEEEQAEPTASDEIYRAWSTYLRVNTREAKKHALLFQENVNYGYRRNIFGLRVFGIITSICCCGISGIWIYSLYHNGANIVEETALLGALAVSFTCLILWYFRFTSEWVHIPAEAYAMRLAEAIDSFKDKPTPKKDKAEKK